jgi:5'-3' exonuclease
MDIFSAMENESPIIEKELVNKPLDYDKTERVLLIDADSLLYTAIYNPDPLVKDDIEESKFRLDNKIQEIHNNIESYYNIVKTMYFLGGSNNFRYELYPEYKANRPKEKHPFISELKEYLATKYEAIIAPKGEADDILYSTYLKCRDNCVVSSIDKDVFFATYNCPQYNYRSYKDVLGTFSQITEEESKLALATQVIMGDVVDNIKGAVGKGKKYCEKHLKLGMTDYQFIKNILIAYKHSYKNYKLAKEMIILNYNLVKLHDLIDM